MQGLADQVSTLRGNMVVVLSKNLVHCHSAVDYHIAPKASTG